MNNQNQVAAGARTAQQPDHLSDPAATGRLQRRAARRFIQDTDGPASGIFLADFDQQGRVLYSVALDDFVTTVLLGGPDLENDRVLRTGDQLFGRTVTALSWVARPAAQMPARRAPLPSSMAWTTALPASPWRASSAPRWTNPRRRQLGYSQPTGRQPASPARATACASTWPAPIP